MIGIIHSGTVVSTTPSLKKPGANNGVVLQFANNERGYLYFRRCAGDDFAGQLAALELLQVGTTTEVMVDKKITMNIDGAEVEVYRCSQQAAVRRRQQEFCERAAADRVEFDSKVMAVHPSYAVVELNDGIYGVLHATRFACSPQEAEAKLSTLAVGETIKVVISEPNGHRRVRVAQVS